MSAAPGHPAQIADGPAYGFAITFGMRVRMLLTTLALACLGLGPAATAQKRAPVQDPTPLLDKVSDYVQQYYSRAQSLIGREDVDIQPIKSDRGAIGPSTRYGYLLRLEWTPPGPGEPPAATMIRELTTINGKRPKPKDAPKCFEPRESWSEPLAMFLPHSRPEYFFKSAGSARLDGQVVMRVDFQMRRQANEVAEPEWSPRGNDDCVTFSNPGRVGGRVWASPETGEVLRLEQHIVSQFELSVPEKQRRNWGTSYLTFERWDQSIRYRRVLFSAPDEQIVLPESIETIQMARGPAQALRISQRFSDYHRFVASGHIVE